MRLVHKAIITVWTTALASPILFVLTAYARGECGEYDSCSTGQPPPLWEAATVLALLLLLLHAAFLAMIWRSGSAD